MTDSAQESWLINVDSFDFPGEEYQDFAKGQALDLAISASIGCSDRPYLPEGLRTR